MTQIPDIMNTIFDIQDLGSEIAKLRKQQKLSQTDVARRAGVSRAMISDHWRRARCTIRESARYCGCSRFLGEEIRLVPLSPPTLDDLLAEQDDVHA